MIVAYVGLPGSGKTYLMSRDLIKEMAHKRKVWSNYPLKGARRFDDLKQVLNVRRGVIAADELQMIAPSRLFRQLPTSYFALWTQGRHMGIDLWFTCQNFHRVDVSIRGVTNFVWVCKRVFGKIHKAELFDADDIERERMRAKPLKKRWFIESKRVYRIYDTMHMVKPPEHLNMRNLDEDFDPDTLPIFGPDLEVIGGYDNDPIYEPIDEDAGDE
jgi:zona occludens toxin (predicted ATPase)